MRAAAFLALLLAAGCDTPAPPSPPARAAAQTTAPSLGAWMKANASPAMGSGDPAALASVFDRIANTTRDEAYPEWRTLAVRGKAAAEARDLEACRQACK